MKKILLIVAFCLFGLQMQAQVPMYVSNNSSVPITFYLSGYGNRLSCGSELMLTQTIGAGNSMAFNSWTTGVWIQGGTPNSYSAAQAQANFGQAIWTQFRWHTTGTLGCGNWLHPTNCYGSEILYAGTSQPCNFLTQAKWTNYGTYITVVVTNL